MSIFETNWRLLEAGQTEAEWNAGRPLTIAAGSEDLANIYSSDDSTVATTRADAIRAAHMFAAAPDVASCAGSKSTVLRHLYFLISFQVFQPNNFICCPGKRRRFF